MSTRLRPALSLQLPTPFVCARSCIAALSRAARSQVVHVPFRRRHTRSRVQSSATAALSDALSVAVSPAFRQKSTPQTWFGTLSRTLESTAWYPFSKSWLISSSVSILCDIVCLGLRDNAVRPMLPTKYLSLLSPALAMIGVPRERQRLHQVVCPVHSSDRLEINGVPTLVNGCISAQSHRQFSLSGFCGERCHQSRSEQGSVLQSRFQEQEFHIL